MNEPLFFLDTYTYKNNNEVELPLYLGTIKKENRYYWIRDNEEILYLSNSEEVLTNILTKPCRGRYILINYFRPWLGDGPDNTWMIVEMSNISITVINEDNNMFRILNPIIIQSLHLDGTIDYKTIKYSIDNPETCEYNIRLEEINCILEISSQEDKEKLRKYFCL